MRSWTMVLLVVTALSRVPARAADGEGRCERDFVGGKVVGYGELLRRQKAARNDTSVLIANEEQRAAYVLRRHEEALARLAAKYPEEAIESAYALLHSVKRLTQYTFWLSHSYLPDHMSAEERRFHLPNIQLDLGVDFVAGGPLHFVESTDLMELTVALTDGRLGSLELVDVLPSGKTGREVLELARARERARVAARHEAALAAVLSKYSEQQIEAAYKVLYRNYGRGTLASWIEYCYLRGTPGPQHKRRFQQGFAAELGLEFVTGGPQKYEPNPEMVEFTLALTAGSLDDFSLVTTLPSGKSALEVLFPAPEAPPESKPWRALLGVFRR